MDKYARSPSPGSDTTLNEPLPSPKLGGPKRGGPKLGGLGSRLRLRWWLRVSVLLNVAAAVFFVHQALGPLEVALVADLAITATEFAPVSAVAPASVAARYIPGMEGGECSLCAVNPELCKELGPKNAIRGLGYRGENARLRRMLARLRAGKPFNIAVVGGSGESPTPRVS